MIQKMTLKVLAYKIENKTKLGKKLLIGLLFDLYL